MKGEIDASTTTLADTIESTSFGNRPTSWDGLRKDTRSPHTYIATWHHTKSAHQSRSHEPQTKFHATCKESTFWRNPQRWSSHRPQQRKYQSLLRDLRYLADSIRLDISFPVTLLAQHLQEPTSQHLLLLRHTLRYLNSTSEHGILYQKSTDYPLSTLDDADYVYARDLHSTNGHAHTSFGAPVSRKLNKQAIISLSTSESE